MLWLAFLSHQVNPAHLHRGSSLNCIFCSRVRQGSVVMLAFPKMKLAKDKINSLARVGCQRIRLSFLGVQVFSQIPRELAFSRVLEAPSRGESHELRGSRVRHTQPDSPLVASKQSCASSRLLKEFPNSRLKRGGRLVCISFPHH